MASMRTGAQIIWEALVREGVSTVFGYPGGAILPAYDALLEYPIRHVLVRHEQGATHMADGYARASGEVGVAVATSGPGATNMVTGIATAMLDSSPLLCITGQVGSKLIGSDAFQETDVTGVTLPITKHNYLVSHVDRDCSRDPRGDVRGALRPAGAGAHRHHEGRATGVDRGRLEPAGRQAAGLPARPSRVRRGVPAGCRPAEQREAADHLRWPRCAALGCDGAGPGAGRARRYPHRHDPAGHRRGSGPASAEHGHDGDARRGVGQRRHPGGGPPGRARHALRRPGHRQRAHLRSERAQDPHRHRPGGIQQERQGGRGARRRPGGGSG